MPIFEYACDECGAKFEKLVRRSEDGIECPTCASKQLTQQLSTFSAHANGAPSKGASAMPSCPAGMCGTPGLCGRN